MTILFDDPLSIDRINSPLYNDCRPSVLISYPYDIIILYNLVNSSYSYNIVCNAIKRHVSPHWVRTFPKQGFAVVVVVFSRPTRVVRHPYTDAPVPVVRITILIFRSPLAAAVGNVILPPIRIFDPRFILSNSTYDCGRIAFAFIKPRLHQGDNQQHYFVFCNMFHRQYVSIIFHALMWQGKSSHFFFRITRVEKTIDGRHWHVTIKLFVNRHIIWTNCFCSQFSSVTGDDWSNFHFKV